MHSLSLARARTSIDAVFAAFPPPEGGDAQAAVSAVTTWIELLLEWNARIDLTAARTEEELCDLMLADALVLARHLPRGARVVDVGSGAGAPGLPLALLRPDLAVTLIEPLAKRVAFVRTVLGTLNRLDVRLERGRGEQARGTWDVAISRATLAPPDWLALGARLVEPGGSVWVLLAREPAPSVAGSLGVTLADDVPYTWPGTGVARRAIRYART